MTVLKNIRKKSLEITRRLQSASFPYEKTVGMMQIDVYFFL